MLVRSGDAGAGGVVYVPSPRWRDADLRRVSSFNRRREEEPQIGLSDAGA